MKLKSKKLLLTALTTIVPLSVVSLIACSTNGGGVLLRHHLQ
ncbi:hypothetical protein ACA758_00220 [Mycoplasmopsis agassizii]